MIIYLAGPMSGLLDDNLPSFLDMAAALRKQGHVVFCPGELGTRDLRTWEAYVARDTAKLVACSTVAVLPGWEKSRGALLEVFAATVYDKRLVDAEALCAGGFCEIEVRMEDILRLIREAFTRAPKGTTEG